jgi:hypothetical protein
VPSNPRIWDSAVAPCHGGMATVVAQGESGHRRGPGPTLLLSSMTRRNMVEDVSPSWLQIHRRHGQQQNLSQKPSIIDSRPYFSARN